MPFVSELRPGTKLIDDTNWRSYARPKGSPNWAGYIERDWTAQPLASLEGTESFPQALLISRVEWKERIEEMQRTKTRLSDICRASGVKWLHQANTNYCWCYAVVQGVMIVRLDNNQPYARLSPASVAAPVKNYSNSGGWGSQALEYIIKHGVATEEFWPQNAIDRKYFDSSRANAALHKVEKWYDLRPGNFDEKMSCLLRRLPVPSGYNWMGHEMCSCDPLVLSNGGFGCLDLNSYSGDGTFDEYALNESRGNASDAVVPLVVQPSAK